MPAADTALLLIDVQQSFYCPPPWDAQDVPAFLAACNTLIAGCLSAMCQSVQVFHVEDDGAFCLASGLVRPLDGVAGVCRAGAHRQTRTTPLPTPGLDRWLRRRGIRQVLIAGIRSEQCCRNQRAGGVRIWAMKSILSAHHADFAMRHPLSGAHSAPPTSARAPSWCCRALCPSILQRVERALARLMQIERHRTLPAR